MRKNLLRPTSFLYAITGVAIKSLCQTETISLRAPIIQVDLSLVANAHFGLRAGPVAEKLGTSLGVGKVITEVSQKNARPCSVSITVSLTPIQRTLTLIHL